MRQKIAQMAKYHVIIPAAGSGSRFGSIQPKQYNLVLGRMVLDWAVQIFANSPLINSILVVVNPFNDTAINLKWENHSKLKIVKLGGKTRYESVQNGLSQIECDKDDWILVHDAARCCLHPQDLQNLIDTLKDSLTGGILAQKSTDTVKQVNKEHMIVNTLERSLIYLAQTPQMFRFSVLQQALAHADKEAVTITDESSAVESLGLKVQAIESVHHNPKLTYHEDLKIIEALINQRIKEGLYV